MYNNYLELQYNISGNQAGISTSSVMKLYESNSLSRLDEGLKKRNIYICFSSSELSCWYCHINKWCKLSSSLVTTCLAFLCTT